MNQIESGQRDTWSRRHGPGGGPGSSAGTAVPLKVARVGRAALLSQPAAQCLLLIAGGCVQGRRRKVCGAQKSLSPEQAPRPVLSQSQAADKRPRGAEKSWRKEREILITAWEAVLISKPSRSPGG